MATINISLPNRLKSEAEKLISLGLYASFSDLVRDSIRDTLGKNKYDLWAAEAKQDIKQGRGKVVNTKRELREYIMNL